jgi:hypothetical protein
MKKRLLTIWTVLLIAMLAISPVYAGGVKVGFSLGLSLDADGNGFGFSSYEEVQVTLNARALVHVSCLSPGSGIVVPGQNPIVAADAEATDFVTSDKNGKFPVNLSAEAVVSPAQAGCPNNNWIVQNDFEDWYWASITVTQVSSGETLWYKEYACTSTPTTVDCKAIK